MIAPNPEDDPSMIGIAAEFVEAWLQDSRWLSPELGADLPGHKQA